MQDIGLPEPLQGQWIWKDSRRKEVDGYALFRRKFTLNEAPRTAELWATAGTLFHIYVNGRHLAYGPSPSRGNRYNIAYFDIGFCLEMGNNVIAVIAHNAAVSRSDRPQKKSGFWCQLNVEEQPFLWSGEGWRFNPGKFYRKHQPRVSARGGFIETLDCREYPNNWTQLNFNASAWDRVTNIEPVNPDVDVFVPELNLDPVSEKILFDNLIFVGKATHEKATTHVFIPGVIKNAKGLYVSETFVEGSEPLPETPFYIFSDDPYCLFVNNELVKKQGDMGNPDWQDPAWNCPKCYQEGGTTFVEGSMTLKEGWNRILLYQQIGSNSAGITIVFPDVSEGEFKFVKNMSAFGLPGWNFAGPLDIPFSRAAGTLSLEGLSQSSYYAIHPCDEAAHLLTYDYEAGELFEEPLEFIEMSQGEYAVVEINRFQRGCLEFSITGSGGDKVHIVYGETLQGNIVIPHNRGIRRIYSLTLADGTLNWQAISPQGMKYVMIVVAHAAAKVTLEDIGIRRLTFNLNDQNSFSCSDELMNEIWEIGLDTLSATYDYQFLSSAGCLETQLLGDAMIQGIASLMIYGDRRLSEKALRDFADAQYETGEIPSVVPSDLSVRYHDFGLLWPIWLQAHVLYTGDKQFLTAMIPHLQRLLGFFNGISLPETGAIGNLEEPYEVPSLIDYDLTIEQKGIPTALNALYCLSLTKAEWIFSLVEHKDEAAECKELAAKIAGALRELTWDNKKGLFADCWYDGKRSEVYSMQTNVLAAYAGIVDADGCNAIFDKIFFDYAPYQEVITDKDNENPYFKYFLLEMAFSLNRRDWAIEYMRYYWGKMLQEGAMTWWDKFCPDVEYSPEQTHSTCHGYGISPNFFYIRDIVGIHPAEPGSSRIYFNPVLTACEWVRAKIRFQQGTIAVDWSHQESGELEIRIDADFPLEVVPQLDPNVAANANIHISDDVTIIEA